MGSLRHRCTVELLSTVLPEYLESPVKTRRLTDPHGTAVAKVVVTCLYACLSRCGKFLILKESRNCEECFANRPSSKRGDEPPEAKIRRIDPSEMPSCSSSEVMSALGLFLARLQAATVSKSSSSSSSSSGSQVGHAFRIHEYFCLSRNTCSKSNSTISAVF